MKLSHTQALLAQKLADGSLGAYAVLVGLGEDESVLTSPGVDEDTLFDIASCGKILHTMPLALQAISEGKLRLDTTLPEFFDDVPEEKRDITAFQLLTHTSGIIRTEFSRETAAQGIDAVAAFILSHPLAYKPGSDHIYSCNGMNLVAFMLEKIYGKTLEQLFEERLKKPLGLTRSCFRIPVDEPNNVPCYCRRNAQGEPFDDNNMRAWGSAMGAGGSFYNLHDLRKHIAAVMEKSDVLYPAEWHDRAETDYTPRYSEGRGLGYLVVDERYHQTGKLFPKGSFGHCGHTGQSIYMNRELGLRVVLLTDATRCAARRENFAGHDYSLVTSLREELHNEILRDLIEAGRL